MSHRKKNPHCESCVRARMQTKAARRKRRKEEELPTVFGESVTADHLVLSESNAGEWGGTSAGRARARAALTVLDRGTGWLACYPLPGKSADAAYAALSDFEGPRSLVQKFYSDNAPELVQAVRRLGWSHETSTPGQPQTNGVAERANRTVLEGARTILEHAGLPPQWWPRAVQFLCFARNIEIVRGDSSWNRRHGKGHFKGPQVPFGALVDFMPSPVRGEAQKFAPRAVPGIFWATTSRPVGFGRGMCLLPPFPTSRPPRERRDPLTCRSTG